MRGLQDAQILQLGDEPTIFFAGAMRPLVHLIRIPCDYRKKPQLPAETPRKCCADKDERNSQQLIPVALQPTVPRHATGQMMVNGVWAADPFTDERCVLADVGILDPVNESSGEIRSEDDAGCLKGDGNDVVHDPASLAHKHPGDDIDSPDVSID